MTIQQINKNFKRRSSSEKKVVLQRFFKTGKVDVSYGVVVGDTRRITKQNYDLSLMEMEQILYDNVHAVRLCGLLVLVHQFQGGNPRKHKLIHDFYMRNTKQVNNWDLLDLGADKMVGA